MLHYALQVDLLMNIKCANCHYRFDSVEALQQHWNSEHADEEEGTAAAAEVYTPKEVDVASPRQARLVMHVRTHTGEKTFACPRPDCDYQCAQQGTLTRHFEVSTAVHL